MRKNMKDLMKHFKELTGYSLEDIGDKFGVSRQHISLLSKKESLTRKASFAFMVNCMIDEKIHELKMQILNLEMLKSAIEYEVKHTKSGESHEE